MRKEDALPQGEPRLHLHVALTALVLIVLCVVGTAAANGLV